MSINIKRGEIRREETVADEERREEKRQFDIR